MGNGLAEVVFLAALTVVVLPCALFALLALLDRFERSLDPDLQTPPQLVVTTPASAVAVDDPWSQDSLDDSFDDETVGGDVVPLPIAVTMTQSPAAATG